MSGWLPVLALGLVSAAFLWRFAHPTGMAALGVVAAILIGVAGYAMQGHPDLPSAPRAARADAYRGDTSFARERGALLENLGDVGGWLNFADALQRAGLTEKSVEAMKAATRTFPKSPDLWVGLGNALVVHGDGYVSPAARLAFQRAADLEPDHPAPLYFLGMAWLQSGQPAEALAAWQRLRAASPPDAPWLPDLDRKIAAAKMMMDAGVGAP